MALVVAPGSTLAAQITSAANQAGIDPNLLAAVVQQESGGNPWALSPTGAQGLTQLEPGTAAAYGVSNPWDPMQNLLGGAKYLRDLLNQFAGNSSLAIAAYNAGPAAVTQYGGIPPYAETQAYVPAVQSLQSQYQASGIFNSGGTGGSSIPVLGGLGNALGSAGNTIGGIPGALGSAFVTPVLSGTAGAIQSAGTALAQQFGHFLLTIANAIKKWVVLILLALLALIVADQLLSGGKGAQAVGSIAKVAAA